MISKHDLLAAALFSAFIAAAAPGCGPSQASAGQSARLYAAIRGASAAPDSGGSSDGSGKTPENALMNSLEGPFGPVKFGHKAHADMAQMGGGCVLCHHHSHPGQPLPPCARCHTVPLDEKTAGRLGYKGAVHAQCMGCHDECGASRDCLLCHGRKGEAPRGRTGPWPRLGQPEIKTYRTAREGGDKVAFDHKNHAKECGPCSACHKDEGCTACHGDEGARAPKRRPADPHAKCMDCHGKGADLEFDCSDCHAR